MKKYKIEPINSYYHYKKRKRWFKRGFFLVVGLMIICIGIIRSQQFREDLQVILQKDIEREKQYKSPESIYLDGHKVAYDLYKGEKEVKGIYLPTSKIEDYKSYIQMTKTTNVNSFVIDVKNDQGYLTFKSDNEKLIERGCVLADPPIQDIEKIIASLYEADIYPIARIVVFKDSVVTKNFPDLAMKSLSGEVFETRTGEKWLNPYNKENWDYILEVCKEAISVGFKEIQLDYVRFHESMGESKVQLDPDKTKTEAITEFIKYICENLEEVDVKISADVFGAVIMSKVDGENVGQDFEELSKHLDYICPMVYPSHYAEGTFGIEYPHIQCYDIILKSMELAQDRLMNNARDERKAQIRPWLQDFTLAGMTPYQYYGEEQIRSQIQGTYDAGINEWLFWNASGKYTEAGLDDE